MKRLIWLVVLELLGFAIAASAQTLSPVVTEYGKGKASGQFQVTNNGLIPAVVTVEPVLFDISSDGQTHARPMDSTVQVDLSEGSARLGPKQTYTFFYKVRCASAPCSVAFLAGMTTDRTDNGIGIRLVLPHSAYICADKAKDCRARIRKAAGVQ